MKELERAISNLSSKTSLDDYGISNKMLKNLNLKIKTAILDLFNKCLESNSLNSGWKISSIVMIPKKGDLTDVKNYRPISMTPCLIRLNEKMIAERMWNHIKNRKILIKNQSGFRSHRQTRDNLFAITQKVIENFNMGKKTCSIFYDIAGAFDKVWHLGLIYRLYELEFPSYLILWIHEFLNKRKFYVKINEDKSINGEIECGVPQGSVLSPLLFSLYINTIPVDNHSSENIKHNSFLFADDLADTFSFSTFGPQIEKRINTRLKELETWLSSWRLKIAPHKCNYIIFSLNKNTGYDEKLNISMYGKEIAQEEKNNIKFLGIRFDKHLCFKNQIDFIKKTSNSRLAILKILAHKSWKLNTTTLVNIYKTLVRSIIDYSLFLYNILSESTQKDCKRFKIVH